jgi:hypothetical protein
MCTKCLGTRLETLELEYCFSFNTVFCENGVYEEVLKWKAREDSTMDDGYKWEFG